MTNGTPKKRWTYEQLNGGQAVLGLQTGTNKFATQKGMKAFGMPRANVLRSDDGKLLEADRQSEGVLTAQRGSNKFASQKGLSPFTTFRPNVCLVQEDGVRRSPVGSQDVLPMQAGTNKYASQSGEVILGARRNQCTLVRGRMPKDKRAEAVIPFQSGTNVFASQNGMTDPPGVGAYRRATLEPEGLNFSEEQIRQSSIDVPWSAGTNKFATQSGLGGFLKHRDVVCKSSGGKSVSDEWQRKSDGILRLQFGTNKLANQSGMTSFGTPRSVLTNCEWKREWVEQMDQAKAEWQTRDHPPHQEDKREDDAIVAEARGEPMDPETLRLGSTVRQYGERESGADQSDDDYSDDSK